MAEFIPKTASNPSDAQLGNDADNTEVFTPIQQQLKSLDGSEDTTGKVTEFKKKKAIKPPTPKAESLKNIQTPSQGDNPDGLNKNSVDTAHKANVKIVRDGEKITQIVVVCNCGETIPLDCIY